MGSIRAGRSGARARRTALGAIAGVLLAAPYAAGSTLVAPHALFIDDETRSTALYVQNMGTEAQDISVDLQFGYPASDASGNVRVTLIEDPPPSEPSAAAWVRALPRRTRLRPGERQAIRFLARPPVDLPGGEYWTRVIVSSQEAEPERPEPIANAVQARLYFETRIIVSLSYRKGDVATGVHMEDLKAEYGGRSVTLDVDLRRIGNAAYLGTLDLSLVDEQRREVGSWSRAIAVYHDLHRRIEMPVGHLPPGRYTMNVRLSGDRSDIPAENLLIAAPVETEMMIVIP